MKAIRKRLGLSTVELGRAFGYEGRDNTVSVTIRKYESGGRSIPPWLARLLTMFDRFGVPDDFKPVAVNRYVIVTNVFTERPDGKWLTTGEFMRIEAIGEDALEIAIATHAGQGIAMTISDLANDRLGEVPLHGHAITWFDEDDG